MASKIHTLVRPPLEASLAAGESLDGIVIANRRTTFSSQTAAIGVTPQRIVVQYLTRKNEPDGAPLSITVDDLRAAKVNVAGDEWWNTEWPLTDAVLTMRLKLADGSKLTLDLMRGGDGLLGRLGGGDDQQAGVAALADWFQRAEER